MYIFYIVVVVLLYFTQFSEQLRQVQQINIGAIFYQNELDLQKSFESTVERFNGENYNFKLLTFIRHVDEDEGSIALQREACDLIDRGVVAIFGPSSKAQNDIVAQICNSTGIPHLQFDVVHVETEQERLHHEMSTNVYPAKTILSKAYADIVQFYGWRKYTVIYDAEDPYALERLEELLNLHELHESIVRLRSFKRGDDYRLLWKGIKGERRVILDCDPELYVDLLSAAIEFNITGQFNHLFLTNLNNFNGSLEMLRSNETFAVNVTSARIRLNGDLYNLNEMEMAAVYDFDAAYSSTMQPKTLLPDLIYDAVSVLVLALRNVTATYQIPRPNVRCVYDAYDRTRTWPMGHHINKLIKATFGINSTDFRTTDLQFDEYGQRISFDIEIYHPLDNYGIAFWNPKGEITPQQIDVKVAKKMIYRVATKFDEPYFMINQEAAENNATGNDLYMGYSVDLIAALAEKVGFDYIFYPVPDNIVGQYNKATKQWNGIIGEIVNNDAQLGICDLTITQARRTAVDFTVPFMQLGISLLAYQKPYEPKNILAYLEPYSVDVWAYIFLATIAVCFIFVFIARISKEEWENPHPCDRNPETLENNWGLENSFWLTMASITTAGSDILPRSPSMRSFNAMWWIFAIIIANSYTANMAAFLTNSKNKGTIESVKDLAEQKDVKFGTILGGSTHTFFAESNETTYRLAYNIMNNDDPSAYTRSNPEGRDRVLKSQGTYMFLMETTALEYNMERSCELRSVGEKFSEKHYAIAVPIGAEYRAALSVGILKLSESNELFRLKNKWWKNEERNCPAPSSEDSNELTFEGVRGIFYTLIVGLLFAYTLGICEFLTHIQDLVLQEQLPYKEIFKRELKFVFTFWNNSKPIITPSQSLHSSRRSLSRLDSKPADDDEDEPEEESEPKKHLQNGKVSVEEDQF